MKNHKVCLFALSVFICLTATNVMADPLQPAQATAATQTPAVPPAQGRKKRVAIFDFDYATVHAGVAGIFGQDVDIGKGISDLLATYLVKDGSYSVIERKALDKILAEQNFSNSDRANATSAAKIVKLLGVDAIIVGSIILRNSAMRPRTRTSAAQAAAGRSWALEDLATKSQKPSWL
jgi:curli biogenesis system outer membrane secretion channel CsgG